jgi:hypothetical protein
MSQPCRARETTLPRIPDPHDVALPPPLGKEGPYRRAKIRNPARPAGALIPPKQLIEHIPGVDRDRHIKEQLPIKSWTPQLDSRPPLLTHPIIEKRWKRTSDPSSDIPDKAGNIGAIRIDRNDRTLRFKHKTIHLK